MQALTLSGCNCSRRVLRTKLNRKNNGQAFPSRFPFAGCGSRSNESRAKRSRRAITNPSPPMLRSILDVPMKCAICGAITRAGDCEPDVDGDGSLGCPVPDCGGIALEVEGNKS